MGTTGDYMPMSFLDPEMGCYFGIDAELAEDLADSLGVKLEYVETTWPSLLEDTIAGRFDLAICGITITDDRREGADVRQLSCKRKNVSLPSGGRLQIYKP